MFIARQQISDQDARTTSSVKGGPALGQVAETADGRTYQYSLAGASNLSAGKLTQAPADVANSITQTGVATTVGQTTITYTVGATAVTADQYAGGYFAVTVGPGQNLYLIDGNTAATSTNSYSITVTLREPITVATTTSSKFTLLPNPFASTVIMDHTAAPAIPVTGAPNVAVTAAYYYWSQVGGYAPVLSDGAITKNAEAIPSNGVDGAAEIRVDATVTKAIGYAPELTVDTAYWPINLTLHN